METERTLVWSAVVSATTFFALTFAAAVLDHNIPARDLLIASVGVTTLAYIAMVNKTETAAMGLAVTSWALGALAAVALLF